VALRDAIARLQSHAGALAGMKEAPIDPPESANQFPFAVSYMRSFSWKIESAGFSHAFVMLITEIHVARNVLPLDVQLALPFFEPFLRKLLADQTLGGTVDNIGGATGGFGSMEYAGHPTLGYQFVLTGPEGDGVKVTIT